MTKPRAILASAIFFFIAPVMVGGAIPWWLAGGYPEFPPSRWQQAAGLLTSCAGVLVLLDSIKRFALEGLGTPAPVLPTEHLVISGLYRYVRNPMYVAVVTTVLGQSMILGNLRVTEYGLWLWLAFHSFVRTYEEPKLRKKYGAEYEAYCEEVPRWIPRLL